MAQITQIVPKFSFPYVDTYVNDNTFVQTSTATNVDESGVTYIWPFVGPMGPDNKFIKITSETQFEKVFGKTDFKKFGQPMMMPVSALSSSNANVWCMRVMPENAKFAYKVMAVAHKVLTGGTTTVTKYRTATASDTNRLMVMKKDGSEVSSYSIANDGVYQFESGQQYGVDGFYPEYVKGAFQYWEAEPDSDTATHFVVPDDVPCMTVSEFTQTYGNVDGVVDGVYVDTTSLTVSESEGDVFITPDGYQTIKVSESELFTVDDIGSYMQTSESMFLVEVSADTEGAMHIIRNDENLTTVDFADVVKSMPTVTSGTVVVSEQVEVTGEPTFDIRLVEFTDTLSDVDKTTVSGLKKVFSDVKATVISDSSSELDGYTVKPVMLVYSNGRGEFGNNYRFRMSRNSVYESEYGINMSTFDILTTVGGLTKVASYIAGNVSSVKYEVNTCINDVLDDYTDTEVPVKIFVDEDYLDVLRDEYVEFCTSRRETVITELVSLLSSGDVTFMHAESTHPYAKKVVPAGTKLNEELQVSLTDVVTSLPDAVVDGYVVSRVDYLKHLEATTVDEALPDTDQFSPFFGKVVAKEYSLPYVKVTVDDSVNFMSAAGCALTGGHDGFLSEDTKRAEKYLTGDPYLSIADIVYGTSYGFTEANATDWSVDHEVELLYNQAFDGTLDSKILSAKRMNVTAWFDANYPMSVKKRMAELVALRNDTLCFLDTGIVPSLSKQYIEKTLIPQFAEFDSYVVSKNLHHYVTREASTGKRVTVTITHFLAPALANHLTTRGNHIPFVKADAQLSGHVRDSIYPIIEDYESDLKDLLYKNRFNYFETVSDNVFQRATQSTSQSVVSDLLEENNVHVLLAMKKLIEKDINDSLYNFADEIDRNSFTSYQKARFATWAGTKFKSMDITFAANAWESENSIIHGYLEVVFRGIYKRAIVEIDINKRTYTDTTTTMVSV